ncbi:ABC transporter permease [Nitratireductor basaltis]|uniref:Putative ferric iron transport system permease protein n=1 Tax=Nitratireductor basaltis TaxID=472175 RepID=A0A084UE99_9HYPH|nr:iron ABC transporter permease [Nitratireductor basaltis]KFB11285.1 putative ferric iron transport system permease protein [Nitratireductor basaltis]
MAFLTDTLPLRSRRRRAESWYEMEGGTIAIFVIGAVAILCVVPMLQLLFAAGGVLRDGLPRAADLLASASVLRATGNSLLIAAGSTVLAMVLGVAVAVILTCMEMRTRRYLGFLFVLSLMVAPQVSALAFKTLAGPSSPILNTLGLAPAPGTPNPMLGFGGIILVMGLHHAPLVALTVAAGLSRVPKSLVEAALLDGAGAWTVVTRIILPVARLYLLSAALLAFVAGVGNFGIPALLGLPVGVTTLPTMVYRQLASFGRGGIENAALVSMLIALIAGAAVIASAWIMARRDVRTDGERGLEPFIEDLNARRICEVALWVIFTFAIILPIASLLATSLVPAYGVTLNFETLTFSQFTGTLWDQALVRRAFANSLIFSGSAAVILSVLALFLAYIVDRRLSRIRLAIMPIVEMPYALPGVVVAIACILLFVNPLPVVGFTIYGTGWIILFAYLASFLAIAVKPVMAAVSSLERSVEEAAILDGASVADRLTKIILPIVLPSVVAGGLMAFLIAFNELTISALLWSAGTETLGVALLNLEDAGLGTEAAALAVVATCVVAGLMAALEAAHRFFPDNALPWHQLCPRKTS